MKKIYIRSLPFILGFGAQVGQVVLLRELFIVFSGNEFSFGIAFSAWLLACGLGSAFGALLMGYVLKIRLLWTLASLLTLGALVGAIGAIRLSHQFFKAPRGQPLSLNELSLTALVSLGVCAFLFGLQYVISIRFLCQKEEGDSSTAYLYEAWGALVGGVLFTFLLIHWSSFSILASLVFVFFFGALVLFRKEERPFFSRATLVGLSLFLLLAVVSGFFSKRADFWLEKKKWDSYFDKNLKLEDSQSTPFGHISHFTSKNQHYLYYNGFQYLTFPNREAGTGKAHFLLNQHLSPKRILIIGGGPQGFSEMLLYPLEKLDYLELDPDLLDLSLKLASPADQKAFRDPRIGVFHQDGRAFIKKAPDHHYDLMALFVPSPSTAALNRYYTLEFFEETRRVLREKGVLILTLESAFSLEESSPKARQNRLIYHTLAKIFKNIKITPGDTNLLLCTNHPENTSLDPKELARRYLEGKIHSPFYASRCTHYSEEVKSQPEFLLKIMGSIFEGLTAPQHIRETMLAYRGEKRKGQEPKKLVLPWLKKSQEKKELDRLYTSPALDENTSLNRDDKPLAPLYYLLAWNREVEKGELPLVQLLEFISWERSLWGLGGLFAGVLLLLLLFRRLGWERGGRTTTLLGGVFAAGFWGMAIEMILLVSFQSRQGYIYSAIGLLIGFFMLGLGLGTFLLTRLLRKSPPAFCFKTILLIQGLLGFLLPHFLYWGEGMVFYALLNWGAGFLVGAIFPVGIACLREMEWAEERAGGWLYSFDVWGATLAAFFTTTFLITRLGIFQTAYLIALFPLCFLGLKGLEEKILGGIKFAFFSQKS